MLSFIYSFQGRVNTGGDKAIKLWGDQTLFWIFPSYALLKLWYHSSKIINSTSVHCASTFHRRILDFCYQCMSIKIYLCIWQTIRFKFFAVFYGRSNHSLPGSYKSVHLGIEIIFISMRTLLYSAREKGDPPHGLYSLSGRTSYRHVSWSLEVAKFDIIMIV